jgi:UDP-glucuronate 4-epimerase
MTNKKEKILVTGCAGFIGMHLCKNLLDNGFLVFGIDNLNNYYDVSLKEKRLENILLYSNFSFKKLDICILPDLEKVFKLFKPDKVVNLAAQAGVRESLKNPNAYISTNVVGFMNILECCRYNNIKRLVYASSSSVYGNNKEKYFSIDHRTDKPISVYGATKKTNELMAYSYAYLYKLNTIGLRFFTVYGPWGRPDMAMFIFAEKILNDNPITVFNHGNMKRDFTYIDDIIDGIVSSLKTNCSHKVFNLGNNKSVNLLSVISLLEYNLKRKANIKYENIQLGDIESTLADISHSKDELNYNPKVNIDEGIFNFINWFKQHKKNN